MRLVSTRFSTAERDTELARSSNHAATWGGPGTGVGEGEARRGGTAPEPGGVGGPVGSGRSDWDAPIGGWRDSASGCPGWDPTVCRMASRASRDNPGVRRIFFVLTPERGFTGLPPALNPGRGAPE